MHEAYQPIIDDGRGRFPEDLRVKAPRGSHAAIAAAAQIKSTTNSEYVSYKRSCVAWKPMVCRLRRGMVLVSGIES
jgi:hypothetical protein